MSLEECRQSTKVAKILCEENRRKACFLNPRNEEYFKTKVDGCLVRNAVASDWVISRDKVGDVIVELKGKDVDHAVQQIWATAELWRRKGLRMGRLAGLVVCNQYPSIDTKIQRAKLALARAFQAPLHVVCGNYEYSVENVLSFKGPHRR